MKHVQGAAAGRPAPPPGDLGRAGRRGRARDRQGDRQPLRHRRRDGARPRGGAGDRGRAHRRGHRRGHQRPARAVRATPPTSRPRGCATPRALAVERRAAGHRRRGDRVPRHPHREGPRPRRPRRGGARPERGQARARTPPTTTTPRATPRSHPSQAQFAIDGSPPTEWETETYEGGSGAGNKTGVGLYVDAGSRVAARRLDLVTSTPGFRAAVYASDTACPASIEGWTRLEPDRPRVERGPELQPRHAAAALPLLPGVDHEAARRAGKARIQELGLKQVAGCACLAAS